MREIKFRAWDKKKLEMYSNNSNILGNMGSYHPAGQVPNWDIMQYTGLKDRNGKEIYEGDVVQYSTAYYGKLKTDNKQEIKWIEDMEHDGFGEPLATGFLLRGYDWEIIGNIYENPELLTNLNEK
jgi:uncharacterized phage protein (TIGR01671 family)